LDQDIKLFLFLNFELNFSSKTGTYSSFLTWTNKSKSKKLYKECFKKFQSMTSKL